VQLLSSADTEPWLPLLCYDAAKVPALEKVTRDQRLEPHPVSGEVEVDWEAQVETRYKRIDEETLQALVALHDLGLSVKLVWCVHDEAGGADGWRIGEVGVPDRTGPSWGESSITAAEAAFKTPQQPAANASSTGSSLLAPSQDDDDDDDYWGQYDKTPGHTPAPKASPAPPARGRSADEDSYFAQYASVQPAMDNHDPDEAQQNGQVVETSLGRDEITRELQSTLSPQNPEFSEPPAPWAEPYINGTHNGDGEANGVAQPRPSSSQSSSGSDTVARLERRAAQNSVKEQSEIGIKQHISSTMKSLYRLSKIGGIERGEFERLVRTELECLALMDEDDV
jgi:hypothetical protein